MVVGYVHQIGGLIVADRIGDGEKMMRGGAVKEVSHNIRNSLFPLSDSRIAFLTHRIPP